MNAIKTKQLDLLLHDFELLARTAVTQWHICSKLLEDNNISTLYEEAEANEIILDRLEVKLREEVVFTIFQFNPVAADLRKIITYLDVTTNLERIGDLLLNIIHFLRQTELAHPAFDPLARRLREMAQRAGSMLNLSIVAFSSTDTEKAYAVIQEDDKLDALFNEIGVYLQEKFSGVPLDKAEVRNMIHLSAISYNLERVGDSTTNIAEAAIFLAEGKDIRHGNAKT
ncbi:MAG: hypothetical protein LBL81_00395 [Tannerella sp.]|jgi:phosphate transport system protein|nr:hypothetical protein [Tannerella sp.]